MNRLLLFISFLLFSQGYQPDFNLVHASEVDSITVTQGHSGTVSLHLKSDNVCVPLIKVHLLDLALRDFDKNQFWVSEVSLSKSLQLFNSRSNSPPLS